MVDGSGYSFGGGGEQVDGGGFVELAIKSALAQAVAEVGFDLVWGQRGKHVGTGDSAVERAVTLQAQGAEQMSVSDEDQAEERLNGQIQTEQQPEFFEGAGMVVLRFIEYDDGDDAAKLMDCFFELYEIRGPAAGGLFSEFIEQGTNPTFPVFCVTRCECASASFFRHYI